MKDRDWRLFIDDMIEFCENVVAYTEGLDERGRERSDRGYP